MLRLLFRLYWLQKRRDFNKRDVVVTLYLLSIYVLVGIGVYLNTAEKYPLKHEDAPPFVALFFASTLTVADILMKITMKSTPAAMDDYLKARPIAESTWTKFLLLSNAVSVWNFVIPLLMLPLLLLFLNAGWALAGLLLMIMLSYANTLYVSCFRRTSDHLLRGMLIGGWLLMFFLLWAITIFGMMIPAWMSFSGVLLIGIGVIAGLALFIAHEDNYDESKHKATRQRSLGKVTLFSIQFYGIIRAKRLRYMMLIMVALFIGDAYLNVIFDTVDDNTIVIDSVMAVLMPSLVLSQWTFGVEANFFEGLVTKPMTVERLLTNCFVFYLLLSFVGALMLVPLLFMTDVFTPLMLLASFDLAVFINLFNMPTCLFSTRLELFSKSLFTTQGANIKINFYAVALLIPLALFVGIWLLWGATVWAMASITAGVVSLLVYKPVIRKIAIIFDNRKYTRLEAFK